MSNDRPSPTETVVRLFPRWFKSQQLALHCYFMSEGRQNALRLGAFCSMDKLLTREGTDYRSILESLRPPPHVLLALSEINPVFGGEASESAESIRDAAYHAITFAGPKPRVEGSVWRDAERIASALLQGSMGSLAWLRFLSDVAQRDGVEKWQDPSYQRRLQRLIDYLRPSINSLSHEANRNQENLATTIEQLEAIAALRGELQEYMNAPNGKKDLREILTWEDLENVLLQLVFHWPLTVSPKYEVILPVPVAIEASLDGAGTPCSVDVIDHHLVDVSDWTEVRPEDENGVPKEPPQRNLDEYTRGVVNRECEKSELSRLEYSVFAAKKMLLGRKRGLKSIDDAIKTASCQFDFSLLGRMLECSELPIEFIGRMKLGDGSMEAYFAYSLVNQLSGRGALTGSIASAELGPLCEGERDFVLQPVGFPTRKVRHVFDTRIYQVVVVATDDSGSFHKFVVGCESRQKAHTSIRGRLSQLLSLVCPTWRREFFIRCPEVKRAIREARNVTSESAEVKSFRRKLRESEQGVLDAGCSWRVAVEGLEILRQKGLRSFSFAFIRAVDYEVDELFWRQLWHISGASMYTYNRFVSSDNSGRLTNTVSSASEIIGLALSRSCELPRNLAHCPPDIVFVIGHEQLAQPDSTLIRDRIARDRQEFYRPFRFNDDFESTLAEELKYQVSDSSTSRASIIKRGAARSEELRSIVGTARVVLLKEEVQPIQLAQDSIPDDPADRELYDRLRAFPFSIPLDSVHFVARQSPVLRNKNTIKAIRRLEREEFIAVEDGLVYVPGKMGAPDVSNGTYTRDAARSLCAVVDRSDQGHLADGKALEPEFAHDSLFLAQASTTWTATDDDLYESVDAFINNKKHGGAEYRKRHNHWRAGRNMANNLLLTAIPNSWPAVHEMSRVQGQRRGDVAFLSAMSLVDCDGARKLNRPHPSYVYILGYAAWRYCLFAKESGEFDESLSDHPLRKKIDETVDLLKDALNHEGLEKETADGLRLGVHSMVLLIEMETGGASASSSVAPQTLIDAKNTVFVLPSAFTIIADAQASHSLAAKIYARGWEQSKRFYTNLVKFVGALALNEDPKLLESLRPLMEEGHDGVRVNFNPRTLTYKHAPKELSDKALPEGRRRFLEGARKLVELKDEIDFVYYALGASIMQYYNGKGS